MNEENVSREEFKALEKRVADLEQELQSRPREQSVIPDEEFRELLGESFESYKRSLGRSLQDSSPKIERT